MSHCDDAALGRQLGELRPFSRCETVGQLQAVLAELPPETPLRAGEDNVLYTAIAGGRDGLVLVLEYD